MITDNEPTISDIWGEDVPEVEPEIQPPEIPAESIAEPFGEPEPDESQFPPAMTAAQWRHSGLRCPWEAIEGPQDGTGDVKKEPTGI